MKSLYRYVFLLLLLPAMIAASIFHHSRAGAATAVASSFQCSYVGQKFDPGPQPTGRADQMGAGLQLENLIQRNNHDFRGSVTPQECAIIDAEFAQLEKAGVRWTRDMIGWEEIMHGPNDTGTWAAADALVYAARKHHIRLIWIIGNNVPWDCGGCNTWSTIPAEMLTKPPKRSYFFKFVKTLVARYHNDINDWEVYNEPNYVAFSHRKTGPEYYAQYLVQAYDAIHAVKYPGYHPTVIFGGLGGVVAQNVAGKPQPGQEIQYYDQVVKAIAKLHHKQPYDVVAFHLYGHDFNNPKSSFPNVTCYMSGAFKLLAQHFPTTPLYFTEFDTSANGDSAAGKAAQAEFAKTWYANVPTWKAGSKVFWASLLDDYSSGFPFQSTGLRASKTPLIYNGAFRPVYFAVKGLLDGSVAPKSLPTCSS